MARRAELKPNAAAGPTVRAADYICPRHGAVIVERRLWPDDYDTCPDCLALAGRAPRDIVLLPQLTPAQLLALHEAGHAIAYIHLGVGIHSASLQRSPHVRETVGGHVRLARGTDDLHPIGLWAGTAAVRRMLLQHAEAPTFADLVDIGCNGRNDSAMLRRTGLADAELLAARDEADALIAGSWDAVTRVARALLATGYLSGEQLRSVLAGGQADRPGSGPDSRREIPRNSPGRMMPP
jgi:hypothetical protein